MYPFDVDDMIKDLLKGVRADTTKGTISVPNADAPRQRSPTRVPMSRYVQFMRCESMVLRVLATSSVP